ncbi:RmlC-like cupins superfamily protein [Abeliophyllum distichum]|uniref:RmlC-like cupins superfamily protein n=1 Tax=Abeliophyllum distichum TaxID=126358 RepID=A0ABD1SFG1_9LAMI
MRHKSETQNIIKNFFAWVKTQHNLTIKTLRSDNGQEFLSLQIFLDENGTIFHRSCPYTLQQNGVVERKHRHLLNVARAIRFQANLPLKFWGEHIKTVCYLINRIPSPLLSHKTSYERLHEKPPSYSHLRVYGCLCFATNLRPSHKFDTRARRYVFLGYFSGQKGYTLYDLTDRKLVVSRDVVFHKTIFPYASQQNDETNSIPLPQSMPLDVETPHLTYPEDQHIAETDNMPEHPEHSPIGRPNGRSVPSSVFFQGTQMVDRLHLLADRFYCPFQQRAQTVDRLYLPIDRLSKFRFLHLPASPNNPMSHQMTNFDVPQDQFKSQFT